MISCSRSPVFFEVSCGSREVCVRKVNGCITAHEHAYRLGIIHCDISAGNILLWKDSDGDWYGLLNDWALSRRLNVEHMNERQPNHMVCSIFILSSVDGYKLICISQGTWQFMSAHALNSNTRRIVLPDELESIFHVLLYVAVRFLPHNLPDQDVGQFLYDYFDAYSPYSGGVRCGPAKQDAMCSGEVSLVTYNGDQDPNNMELRFGFDPSIPRLLPSPTLAITGPQVTLPFSALAPGEIPADLATHSSRSHSPVPGSSSARHFNTTAPLNNHSPPDSNDPSPPGPSQANPTSMRRTHPLNAIIDEVLKWFKAYYALESLRPKTSTSGEVEVPALSNTVIPAMKPQVQRLLHERTLNSSLASNAASRAIKKSSTSTLVTTAEIEELRALANNLLSHEPFFRVVMNSLKQLWPEEDKGEDKKPKRKTVVPRNLAPAFSVTHIGSKKRKLEDKDAQKERKRLKTNHQVS